MREALRGLDVTHVFHENFYYVQGGGAPRYCDELRPGREAMGAVSILLALVAGAGMSFQVGANARLTHFVGSPVRAALLQFGVGIVLLGILSVLVFRPWPSNSTLGRGPWWMWVGGLLGAAYIIVSNVASPRIGAGAFVALVVAGQTIAALVIDRFGWVGFAERSLTPGRIVGVVLLVAGAALVRLT